MVFAHPCLHKACAQGGGRRVREREREASAFYLSLPPSLALFIFLMRARRRYAALPSLFGVRPVLSIAHTPPPKRNNCGAECSCGGHRSARKEKKRGEKGSRLGAHTPHTKNLLLENGNIKKRRHLLSATSAGVFYPCCVGVDCVCARARENPRKRNDPPHSRRRRRRPSVAAAQAAGEAGEAGGSGSGAAAEPGCSG